MKNSIAEFTKIDQRIELSLILAAKQLIKDMKNKKISSLAEVEFKVFSQWGDDGIIQWLINNIEIQNKIFIEFGIENYKESNTRFLMMNNNWSGFVIDGSSKNIRELESAYFFWMFDLTAKAAFVDAENINDLILAIYPDGKVGLLHIDIDGNDYWIWKAINVIKPEIVIVEYNSLWGKEREITIPYKKDFSRNAAHYSNLYFGASLKALTELGDKKGYGFIGCNSAGNNAYFVRKDLINEIVKEVSIEEGYVSSKFRESRDINNNLTFLSKTDSINLIKGMPVYDLTMDKIVPL